MPNRGAFEIAVRNLLQKAEESGGSFIDLTAGDIHRLIGGYPARSHRIPTCCDVLYAAMRPGDRVVQKPPKGKGASLTIRFLLPRVSSAT